MGNAKKPKAVKLIIGMLAKSQKLFDKAEEFFVKSFGPIDYKSLVIPFAYTDYYEKEMGRPLKRKFVSFKKLIPQEKIAKIKLLTNSIEEKFSMDKRRRINIDPGYVTDSKLVLATTKDYFHRICLGHGIYAEVTLMWRKGSFRPFEWTYPDYRSEAYTDILNIIRNAYMKEDSSCRIIQKQLPR